MTNILRGMSPPTPSPFQGEGVWGSDEEMEAFSISQNQLFHLKLEKLMKMLKKTVHISLSSLVFFIFIFISLKWCKHDITSVSFFKDGTGNSCLQVKCQWAMPLRFHGATWIAKYLLLGRINTVVKVDGATPKSKGL